MARPVVPATVNEFKPRGGCPRSVEQRSAVVDASEVDAQRLLARRARWEVLADDDERAVALIRADDDPRVAIERINGAARTEADHVTGDWDAPRRRKGPPDLRIAPMDDRHQVRAIADPGSGAGPDAVNRPQEASRQLHALERLDSVRVKGSRADAAGVRTGIDPGEAEGAGRLSIAGAVGATGAVAWRRERPREARRRDGERRNEGPGEALHSQSMQVALPAACR